MKINYILSELRCSGINCYTSWMGKSDGAYLVARIGKSKDALVSLIPIDDENDDRFIDFIKSKTIKKVMGGEK